jgi:hypothetical protein
VGFRKLRNTSPEDGSRCHPKGSVCFLILVTAEKVLVNVDVTHVTQNIGSVDRDLNRKQSEYEAGAVPFRPRRFGGTW